MAYYTILYHAESFSPPKLRPFYRAKILTAPRESNLEEHSVQNVVRLNYKSGFFHSKQPSLKWIHDTEIQTWQLEGTRFEISLSYQLFLRYSMSGDYSFNWISCDNYPRNSYLSYQRGQAKVVDNRDIMCSFYKGVSDLKPGLDFCEYSARSFEVLKIWILVFLPNRTILLTEKPV